jgi:sigma-B regulation protein RsbU (phosphoserine phosphatase)
VPVQASVAGLDIDGVLVRCLIATDLTRRRRTEQLLVEANAVIAAHAADLERAKRGADPLE